jgi:hypothetical protein
MVHDVIVGFKFCCASSVTSRDDVSRFADNVGGDTAHLSDRGLQLGGHSTGGKLPPGQLRHVNGKIAGALEI